MPLDPVDWTMLIAVALALAFAAGVLAGRWAQRREDAPYKAMMRDRLHEANEEIAELQRMYFVPFPGENRCRK